MSIRSIAGYVGNGVSEHVQAIRDVMASRFSGINDFLVNPSGMLFLQGLSNMDVQAWRSSSNVYEGELAIVYNGKIYNKTDLRRELEQTGRPAAGNTDEEIVLHLYKEFGDDCVKKLRGMFSFGLWDFKRNRILVARDHMGQKSLFYTLDKESFVFASEAKTVLASGVSERNIDIEGLWHYMSLRYLPDDHTLFKGIRKLQAGHFAVYENGKVSVHKYWQPDTFKSKVQGSEKELADALERLLLETVEAHLGESDSASIGSFLSGGIDSSLVTAMVAKIRGKPFHTFSIGVKEQDINELPWARMISSKYNLIAREEVVEADIIHKIPEMIFHMDEPSDPFGVGVYLVSQVAAKDVGIVLSGDGGDENFAGYDRFAGQKLAGLYSVFPAWIRRNIFGKIFNLIPESFGYKSFASKLKWLNDMSFYDAGGRYARSMSFLRFTSEYKDALFTGEAIKRVVEIDSAQKILHYFNDGTAEELLDKMLYTDLMTRMPDHLLAISDRMGAANSLEIRPPLIDHKVTEFAASLPCEMKLHGRQLKYILRKVAYRYMPKELIDRPKQGFGFPIARWIRTDLSSFLQTLFSESRFVELGIFRQGELDRLLQEHVGGKADHNFRIWILLNLEIWYRMCMEGESLSNMHEFIDKRL
jgi:asparagine synthase (glutamine-hydrolysing)